MPTERVAREMKLGWAKQKLFQFASRKLTKKARQTNTNYEFLFMHPSGEQLKKIKSLVEEGKIKPIVDKVFHFNETQGALEYSEQGHAKGKIVIQVSE